MLRSDRQYLGVGRSPQRAGAKGAGLIGEELERPVAALVEDGDPIRISLPERELLPPVSDEVRTRRQRNHSPMPPRLTRGHVGHCAEQVASAAQGAVMPR